MASVVAALLGAIVVFGIVAAVYVSSRRNLARVDAAVEQVRPWTQARGYDLRPPSRASRLGIGWGWLAVQGHVRDIRFELSFNRSSHTNEPYTEITAVPTWLPRGGFNIGRDRPSPEAWDESGLWVVASPSEVAAGVKARHLAIAALAALPSLQSVNAWNIEVPGAKRKECRIACEGWVTDAGELDQLINALAGLCA